MKQFSVRETVITLCIELIRELGKLASLGLGALLILYLLLNMVLLFDLVILKDRMDKAKLYI